MPRPISTDEEVRALADADQALQVFRIKTGVGRVQDPEVLGVIDLPGLLFKK